MEFSYSVEKNLFDDNLMTFDSFSRCGSTIFWRRKFVINPFSEKVTQEGEDGDSLLRS